MKRLNLVVFMTEGMSFHAWDRAGIFEREISLYKRLNKKGVTVKFVTFGSYKDLTFRDRLEGLGVLCNKWRLPIKWYRRFLATLHGRTLRKADIIKTNQIKGGHLASQIARKLRKKLVARCGYLVSDFAELGKQVKSSDVKEILSKERDLFCTADRVVVTTDSMKDTVVKRHGVDARKVTVIPNYVDTDVFRPSPAMDQRPGRICVIGRLDPQKNLLMLVEAVRGFEVEVLFIGDGILREELVQKTRLYNVRATFLGRIQNSLLPEHLRSSELFVLPSLYEGHPKALIEAMACGLPVIGTDVPGIREVIVHGETGILCGVSVNELRAAMLEVLGNREKARKMGERARKFVVDNFSLDKVVELELDMLWSLME